MRAREYDIESVHAKQRRRVRHGLESLYVRPATKAQLLSQGWSLNLSTMARQGRFDPEFGNRLYRVPASGEPMRTTRKCWPLFRLRT